MVRPGERCSCKKDPQLGSQNPGVSGLTLIQMKSEWRWRMHRNATLWHFPCSFATHFILIQRIENDSHTKPQAWFRNTLQFMLHTLQYWESYLAMAFKYTAKSGLLWRGGKILLETTPNKIALLTSGYQNKFWELTSQQHTLQRLNPLHLKCKD